MKIYKYFYQCVVFCDLHCAVKGTRNIFLYKIREKIILKINFSITFYSNDLWLSEYTRVRNVSGTGGQRPRGRSVTWKQYYLRSGERQWPYYCCIMNCMESADGGGHVHVEGRRRNAVYIVPMCDRRHNNAQNMQWLPVVHGTVAMPVDNVAIDENDSWCVIV